METLLESFDKTEAEVMELLQEEKEEPQFTRKETAEILRTNLNTLNSWIHRGHVERKPWFTREDLYTLATIVSLVSGGLTLPAAVTIAATVVKYLVGNGLTPNQVRPEHLAGLQRGKLALSVDYGKIRREVDGELERRGYTV